jgi:hypothetical protein
MIYKLNDVMAFALLSLILCDNIKSDILCIRALESDSFYMIHDRSIDPS